MAFCNSCGANLDAGAKFCAKCGTVQPDVPTTVAYSQPAPVAVPPSSNSALKIALIAIAAIVVLGLFGSVAATIIGLRIAHRTKVEQSDGKVRVHGPFGTVETTKDPEEAARSLGVDVYPGARVMHDGAANVNIAGSHTVAASFESDDPPAKVAEFYKSRFPNARISSSDASGYSIVSTEQKKIVTIHIQPEGDKTVIHIAAINGNAVVLGNDSDDSKD